MWPHMTPYDSRVFQLIQNKSAWHHVTPCEGMRQLQDMWKCDTVLFSLATFEIMKETPNHIKSWTVKLAFALNQIEYWKRHSCVSFKWSCWTQCDSVENSIWIVIEWVSCSVNKQRLVHSVCLYTHVYAICVLWYYTMHCETHMHIYAHKHANTNTDIHSHIRTHFMKESRVSKFTLCAFHVCLRRLYKGE